MRRLALALAALLLAACDGPAEFNAPLGPPGSAPYDERLIGQWYSLDPGDKAIATLIIEPGAEEGYLDGAFGMMAVTGGTEGEANFLWLTRSAYASVLDGQTYYNTLLIDGGAVKKRPGDDLETEGDDYYAADVEHGYWIARAEVGPDEVLTLEFLSENAPKSAGHTARDAECSGDCDVRIFDLTPEQLADLIRTVPPEDLFRVRMAFARFGSPPPQQSLK